MANELGYDDGGCAAYDRSLELADEANYELNARHDDIRERYGDPCPGCGTLRWQADCPKCYREICSEEADEIAGLALPAPVAPVAVPVFDEDDIPF